MKNKIIFDDPDEIPRFTFDDQDPLNPNLIHSETDETGYLVFDDGTGPTEESETAFFRKYYDPAKG